MIMAWLEMYNSEHKGNNYPPAVSPRISFSNDFAESQHFLKQQDNQKISNNGGASASGSRGSEDPVSSSDNFEFSVSNYSMMSADELFFKGKLLPYNGGGPRTLREELLTGEDDSAAASAAASGVSFRPPKGSGRWKGFLGRKRSHSGSSKKGVVTVSNTSQETSNEGGENCKDFEFGV